MAWLLSGGVGAFLEVACMGNMVLWAWYGALFSIYIYTCNHECSSYSFFHGTSGYETTITSRLRGFCFGADMLHSVPCDRLDVDRADHKTMSTLGYDSYMLRYMDIDLRQKL